MNIQKMMKQAQAMQKNMKKVQDELAELRVTFTAGGGMVTAEASGDGNLVGLTIDPKVVDPDDVEMLEDLVMAAVEGAISEAKQTAEAEMAKVTKGMGLPGMM